MLDILAALIEEMFGVKKQKQAQPRRETRQDGSATFSPASRPQMQPQLSRREPEHEYEEPPKPSEQRQFDDLVRQFFGIPADDPIEAMDVAAEPEVPPPARQRTAHQPPAEQALPRKPEPPPASRPILEGTLGANYQTPPVAPIPSVAAEIRATKNSGERAFGHELAKKLRANPEAARAAFIYSEILGPPVADKP